MSANSGLLAAILAMPVQSEAGPDAGPFSDAEIRAILLHGPWPQPIREDPSNRVSGRRAAIDLGERLFFDRRLSGGGRFSCGSCHVPERNWTDNLPRGVAAGEVARNTPTLMNVRLGRWFGWDGAADSLWAQSMRPILDARELGASTGQVAAIVRSDDQLACRYRRAFGVAPGSRDDEALLVDVAKALAAFQETFETPPAPFDAFRGALARGERITPLVYSEAAQRGVKIFVGKGKCSRCHSGPNFSDGEFHDNGFSAYAAKGAEDTGRPEGLKRLATDRFNLLGGYNDDPKRVGVEGLRRALHTPATARAFKVPTLRHLLLTAPYGHHGALATLSDVVRHYSEKGSPEIAPLKLTAAEQSDLVVFLESLSTFGNPWRPEDMGRCE